MADSIYVESSGAYRPTDLALGPWGDGWQHGSAPTALAGLLLEEAHPDDGFFLARLTVDFVRVVPLEPIEASPRAVRTGRRSALDEIVLQVRGQPVLRATALWLRTSGRISGDRSLDLPPPNAGRDLEFPSGAPQVGFRHAVDVRFVRGDGGQGPAVAWFRLRYPVVDGREITPLTRALAAADFGNGIAAPADFAQTWFVNPDLSVYLHRRPDDAWVAVDATAVAQPWGIGRSEARLVDSSGTFGLAIQNLLIEPRS